MDMDRDSEQFSRMSVVELGRRRRWTVAEKVRIVEESLSGQRRASATARRHDITNSLLFKWRKAYREDGLGGAAVAVFVPAVVVASEGEVEGAPSPAGGRMEIVGADGRRIDVGADVDAAALGRVLDVLARR